ncbi:Na(+)/H(+) antiporter subunit B [Sulfidibacter corallicola]|uniref:Na(+)/H(+) antiporter subunit B n=1 Tax=Sulfidibacter corallicola TaxID=2818388 RepID=A0A8A4TJ40_SULCO|nr:Na(+)/H(+) antiporter subunit B [Sulfidibacter corallicola]QTD49570.1 Na(+)/H(+) antiporter subunit B [Sulfidibacter corallicola]
MKTIGLLSVLFTGILLMIAVVDFPDWGDPHSPANSYLSTHYIEDVEEETAVPNMVTAVLADYRAFDTMLETSVVFVAGIAIFAILRSIDGTSLAGTTRRLQRRGRSKKEKRKGQGRNRRDEMVAAAEREAAKPDLIVQTTVRLLMPTIQLFALYVIAHGHHSPGGGFQGGVILAAGLILVAMSFGLENTLAQVPEKLSLQLGNLGVLIFAGTGVLCLLLGANFLDYHVLAAIYPATDEIMARSHSMLVVEIGVGFTVMSMLYLIYANLSSHGDLKKGL